MATEVMNAVTHHQKVRVTLSLANPTLVAGQEISGNMEMECRADNGLGLSGMQVEVFGIQELTSRDHSATNLFLHSRTIFQDRTRPSNAVYDLPEPGHNPLPPQYFTARKGRSVFPFSLNIPRSSPASVSFAKGLARVRYEIKASVQVIWRDVRSVVVCTKPVDVVESFNNETELMGKEDGETLVAENGKMWVRGKVVGGFVVPGESACVEFWVRNHTAKKNSSLSLTLTRTLTLPTTSTDPPPLNLSDTLTDISFRGGEYTIPPGAEGVASLVFDVPISARSVRGGVLVGEDDPKTGTKRTSRSLFEIRAMVNVRMGLGIGSKDIVLSIPVPIVHPWAIPPPPSIPYEPYEPYAAPPANYLDLASNRSYTPAPYFDPYQNLVYLPPPSTAPLPYDPYGQQYYYPSSPPPPPSAFPVPGLPSTYYTDPTSSEAHGPAASRIAYNLRMTSRGRSVSPVGRRELPSPPSAAQRPISEVAPQPDKAARPTHIDIPTQTLLQPSAEVLSPRPLKSPRSITGLRELRDMEKAAEAEVKEAEQQATEETKEAEAVEQARKTNPDDDRNKTLPLPPPPASPEKPVSALLAELVSEEPKTPTLKPLKLLKPDESGLDRLEKKLLEQVGTRKPPQPAPPSVRDFFSPPEEQTKPVDIPIRTKSEEESASAISSLTLNGGSPPANAALALDVDAGEESDSRTRRGRFSATKSKSSYDDLSSSHRTERPKAYRKHVKKDSKDKKEKVGEKRDKAKGKVAAWLGGIEDPSPSPPAVRSQSPPPPPPETPKEEEKPEGADADGRSSGFVPVNTFKSRFLQLKAKAVLGEPADERGRGDQLWNGTQRNPWLTHKLPPQPGKLVGVEEKNPWISVNQGGVAYDVRSARGGRGGVVTSVKAIWDQAVAAPVPTSPPLKKPGGAKDLMHLDPSSSGSSTPKPPKSSEKSNSKPALIKSTRVPAVLSSSHAVPMLSSTASLARPVSSSSSPTKEKKLDVLGSVAEETTTATPTRDGPAPTKAGYTPRVKHGLSDFPTKPSLSKGKESEALKGLRQITTTDKDKKPPEMAFGQAKLRDLIKKYQGSG